MGIPKATGNALIHHTHGLQSPQRWTLQRYPSSWFEQIGPNFYNLTIDPSTLECDPEGHPAHACADDQYVLDGVHSLASQLVGSPTTRVRSRTDDHPAVVPMANGTCAQFSHAIEIEYWANESVLRGVITPKLKNRIDGWVATNGKEVRI